jgi:hypothetical protein
MSRYQSNSVRKALIYIENLNCFFSGQSRKTLCLQGPTTPQGKLSTKLSTEKWEICKAVVNQRLSELFGCTFEEVALTGYLTDYLA